MDPMALICDSSILGNNSQKYSTPLNWWVFHGHESNGIESVKNHLKQTKVHGNLPTMDFSLKQTKQHLFLDSEGMCHFHLSFRFSLTFGSSPWDIHPPGNPRPPKAQPDALQFQGGRLRHLGEEFLFQGGEV